MHSTTTSPSSTHKPKSLPIFGPPRAWHTSEFTASDDRVRGGSSQSYLTPSSTLTTARFHGTLDTKTLGGAGFASQRTTTESQVWDLSAFAGIEVVLGQGDGKRYTINIKTQIPEKMENGRDASTIEYAFTFTAPNSSSSSSPLSSTDTNPSESNAIQTTWGKGNETRVFARWQDFEPYYRGKPAPKAEELDVSSIRRWSIMMRSFFEEQSGPFGVTIKSIQARHGPSRTSRDEMSDDEDGVGDEGSSGNEEDGEWLRIAADEKKSSETDRSRSSGSGILNFCAIL